MSIAAALAELERSPELPDHVAYLQQGLAEEQARREQFRQEFARAGNAEFINGRRVVHAPTPPTHAAVISSLASLLGRFVRERGLGEVRAGHCLVGCQRNDYLPDVCFFQTAKAAEFVEDQSVYPPPDLAVEVLSPATADHDRILKRHEYARHGIGEYWIVDADDRMIEQFVLPTGRESYQLKGRLPEGARLTSAVLAGFTIPVADFFNAGIGPQAS